MWASLAAHLTEQPATVARPDLTVLSLHRCCPDAVVLPATGRHELGGPFAAFIEAQANDGVLNPWISVVQQARERSATRSADWWTERRPVGTHTVVSGVVVRSVPLRVAARPLSR